MKNPRAIEILVDLNEAHRLIQRAGEPDCENSPIMLVNASMSLGLARHAINQERAKCWKTGRMDLHKIWSDAFQEMAGVRRELAHMVYNVRYTKKRAEDAEQVVKHLVKARDLLLTDELAPCEWCGKKARRPGKMTCSEACTEEWNFRAT